MVEAQRLQRQPVELRSLIERVVDDQRLQAQARQLQVQVSGEPVSAELDPDRSYLWGFTKVQYSEDAAADFCTMINALRELAEARPAWRMTVSDDYYLSDVDPREVADPAALLED